jgi:glycerol-3-phosphate dehydrogenase
MATEILNFQWSSLDRAKYIEQAKNGKFDLIIIGGGMTGAGVCREAALRGLSFLVIDKNDFAFGTSSRSSKLVHGGLRYIANKQFKVVRESTTERNWLRTHMPNLVRPLAFNLYSYEDWMYSPKKVKLGMFLYNLFSDKFSKYKNYAKPTVLAKEDFLKLEPCIRKEKFTMGGYYYDTNVDDGRLTLETIKESLYLSKNGSVALNYAKVEGFEKDENGKVVGVKIVDQISKSEFSVKGKQVLNCTGIWTDELLKLENKLIRPTKGVHLIIKNERLGNYQAFGLQSKIDRRFYFILRREKYTTIGTTDTDYDGPLDSPVCTKEDSDYLLDGVNFLFPDAHLTEKDIIQTYAGIRPLVVEPGKDASQVSRKHVIIDHADGLVSLIGGKLTIYRLMAEELMYHLVKKGVFQLPKAQLKKYYSMQPFLVGLTKEKFDVEYQKGKEKGLYPDLDEELLEHFQRQYGIQAYEILKMIKEDPSKGVRFIDDTEFVPAEIEWICDHEFAPTLLDMVIRRTEIWMYVHHTKSQEIATKVAAIMKQKYSWTDAQTKTEIQSYVDYIKNWVWF